jgi:hypothetical protein
MSDITKYPDEIWDRFFAFSFGGPDPMTRADVQAKLKGLGINLTKAMGRVQQALEAARAREELAAARAKRPGLIAAANSAIAPVGESLREKLKALIERTFQGGVQAAYYRKLETAASDDDLRSLLEDMQRLEDMEKRKDDGK